jgi:tetratricopeptide (TPR) repeat protein
MAFLGGLFLSGDAVPRAPKEAAKWFAMAADRGIPMAMCNLGIMLLNGEGIPRDYDRAAKLLQQASDEGQANATCSLADMYAQGLGVKKDLDKAAELYRKAIETGDERVKSIAKKHLGQIQTTRPASESTRVATQQLTRKVFEGDIVLGNEHVHVQELLSCDANYVGHYYEGCLHERVDTTLTFASGKKIKLTPTVWGPSAIWRFGNKTYIYHVNQGADSPSALYEMSDSGELVEVSILKVPPGSKMWNMSPNNDKYGRLQRDFDEAYRSASRPATRNGQ